MPKLILDEFTAIAITPQKRRQLRNQRDGKCQCGRPRDVRSKCNCTRCMVWHREWMRNRAK